jgi:hypothetical protein
MRVALESDQLLQALLRGTTLATGAEISGQPPSVVRAHFHAIAKELGRKLIHEGDSFKLGAILKHYDNRRP